MALLLGIVLEPNFYITDEAGTRNNVVITAVHCNKINKHILPLTIMWPKMNPSLLEPLPVQRLWLTSCAVTLEALLITNSESTLTLPFLEKENKGPCYFFFLPFKVIQDSLGFWSPRRGFWISGILDSGFAFSGTWTPYSDRLRVSGFLELNSGFQSPGF